MNKEDYKQYIADELREYLVRVVDSHTFLNKNDKIIDEVMGIDLPLDVKYLIIELMTGSQCSYPIKLFRFNFLAERSEEEVSMLKRLTVLFHNERIVELVKAKSDTNPVTLTQLQNYHQAIIDTIPPGLGHMKLYTKSQFKEA